MLHIYTHTLLCGLESEGRHAIPGTVEHYVRGNESLTCIVNVFVCVITLSVLNHTQRVPEIVLLYLYVQPCELTAIDRSR